MVAADGPLFMDYGDLTVRSFDGVTGAPKGSAAALSAIGQVRPALETNGDVVTGLHKDGTNGTARYSADLGTLKWYVTDSVLSPTVGSDGTVYGYAQPFGDSKQYIYALRGTDGSLKWKVPLDKGIDLGGNRGVFGLTAVGKDGHVYVASIDNMVYAIK